MDISGALKKRGINIVSGIVASLQAGARVDLEAADKYIDDLIDEIGAGKTESPLALLSSADGDYFPVHTLNVVFISMIFSAKLRMSAADRKNVGMGALLHDVGKINMPEHLVWKQTADSAYEQSTLNEHVVFGAHWMNANSAVPENVISIIRDHHENFAGSGYPKGTPDRDLWVGVRIVSLANYFVHLVTEHPEKKGIPAREAFFDISLNTNKKFGLKLASAFINEMGPMLMDGPLFQKTALVMLDSREVAAVMKTEGFGDLFPEIIILTNPQGQKLTRPIPVNLKKDGSRRIVKLLKG
jgi:putative nucleotidyltransferase with HDIG domain